MIKLNRNEVKIVNIVLVVVIAMLSLSVAAGLSKPLSIALSHLHYYMLLRIVVCGTLAFAGYLATQRNKTGVSFLCIAFAALFNPFMPLKAGSLIWIILDVAAIGVYCLAHKRLL